MKKIIALAVLLTSPAMAQYYDQQGQQFIQDQQAFHNQQHQNAINQQMQNEQMRQLRSIYNSQPAYQQGYGRW